MAKINVLDREMCFYTVNEDDYICITDIAKYKKEDGSNDIIRNWIRNRNTIEFLGIWEQLNNPDFKPVEFDGFRKMAGLNSFTLTPKQWVESTNAIGIISKSGRYGGTYAHKDIAFEFASWISVEFSTGFSVIETNPNLAEPLFIYYFLISDEIVETLNAIADGSTSTYPSLKPSDIENLDIHLPPLPEQKAIASVLSSIDDKIDLLHRQNKTLEVRAKPW